MLTRDISYEAGGKKLTGAYAVDDKRTGKRPGILVCHQGGGLRDHEKDRARMLAELGYAAFAYDVYGEIAQSPDQAMAFPGPVRRLFHAGGTRPGARERFRRLG